MLFTIVELCAARKYVIAPNVFYYYRKRKGSVMYKQETLQQIFHRQMKSLTSGVRYLDEFLNQKDFFARRPNLKYTLFNVFVKKMLQPLYNIYAQIPASALDEPVRKEFSDGDNLALTSFIFSMMNIQRLQLTTAQRRIAELETALKSKS